MLDCPGLHQRVSEEILSTTCATSAFSTASLLEIINQKNLLQAREQNPLTRLPGNRVIYYCAGTPISSSARLPYLV